MGIKLGDCVPLGGELGPHLTRCDKGGGLPKFPLDPSNHLATIHQRHRQTGEKQTDIQTGQQSDSIGQTFFGRPFVKRFALCYRSVVCLSVTLVYCGQTVGRIKMKLGTQVGFSPSHIVLGGDPAPLP